MKRSVAGIVTAVGLAVVAAPPALGTPIALQNGTGTFSQGGIYNASQAIDGITSGANGWAIHDGSGTSAQTAVFETVSDIANLGIATLIFTLDMQIGGQHTIGRFRLSATTDHRSQFADGLQTGGDVTANWTVLSPLSAVATSGAAMTVQGDQSLLLSGTSPSTDFYTISVTTLLNNITGIRLEVLEDASLPANGPGRQPDNGNFVLTELTLDAVSQAAVPEPMGLALFATGLLGLAALRRRWA